MDVSVHGDIDACMTENFAKAFDIKTAFDTPCCESMSESVEIEIGYMTLFQS